MDKRTKALMAFLDASHSQYHAVAYLAETMEKAGYTRLQETEKWELAPGGKYYLTRGGSTLLAFRIPNAQAKGFLMSAAHTDRPTFTVKENGELTGKYTRWATERYGGMLIAPWLDRPLSVAGRVMVETENGVESRLVDIDRDLMLIPNVAIHMNRKANEGYNWSVERDAVPLLGSKDAKGKLQKQLEKQAGGKILGHDLTLYVRQKATVWGMDKEYLSAAALDDLSCVWGCTQGFLQAEESENIPVLCAFDSEEVGSGSAQGADTRTLELVLSRICDALGLDQAVMLANSFMVSADNGHALHPNHPELADPTNAPVLNEGVVVKFNAGLKYTTTGLSAAVFRKVCQKANVPLQTYCNRPDIPGGSTLGRVSICHVTVPSVDIGLPQLAMHSCYETVGVEDTLHLEKAMQCYYSATMEMDADGCRIK